MKSYTPMTWPAKAAAAAVTVAIVAVLLESVTAGFVHPAPEAIAARKAVIAAQADQVEKARALNAGQLKAADARSDKRL